MYHRHIIEAAINQVMGKRRKVSLNLLSNENNGNTQQIRRSYGDYC